MTTITPTGPMFNDSGRVYTLNTGDVLIVNQGIALSSTSGYYCVYASGANTITCNGSMSGLAGALLEFGSKITVGATGTLSGTGYGVYMDGGSNSLVNHGSIFGADYGVYVSGTDNIKNYGTIIAGDSSNVAIYVAGSETVKLTNSGTIKETVAGSFSFNSVNASTDSIVNTGKMIGNVALGAGNDSFDTHKGTVVGSIDGGAGTDKITLGASTETVSGGTEADTFFFDTKPSSKHVDHITDFVHGEDTIQLQDSFFEHLGSGHDLSSSAFKDITSHNEGSKNHILYDHSNGYLYYDPDGYEGGGKHDSKPVHFATLDSHPSLNTHDFYIV